MSAQKGTLKMKKKQVEFVENEWLENLCRIQRDEPERFSKLSQSLKISVGHYQLAKQKAFEKKDRAA